MRTVAWILLGCTVVFGWSSHLPEGFRTVKPILIEVAKPRLIFGSVVTLEGVSDPQSAKGCVQTETSRQDQSPSGEVFWPESSFQVASCLLIGGTLLFYGCKLSYKRSGLWWGVLACSLNIIGLGAFLLVMIAFNQNGQQQEYDGDCSHGFNTVPQEYLLAHSEVEAMFAIRIPNGNR